MAERTGAVAGLSPVQPATPQAVLPSNPEALFHLRTEGEGSCWRLQEAVGLVRSKFGSRHKTYSTSTPDTFFRLGSAV